MIMSNMVSLWRWQKVLAYGHWARWGGAVRREKPLQVLGDECPSGFVRLCQTKFFYTLFASRVGFAVVTSAAGGALDRINKRDRVILCQTISAG